MLLHGISSCLSLNLAKAFTPSYCLWLHPSDLFLQCDPLSISMAQVHPTSQLSLQGFPDGQGYLARTRTVPDLTLHVRGSDRYKPQWYRNDQNPHRGNQYFYFSPLYYQNLHPHRYAPCANLAPFKYDTHWANYKGAWFDYLEWFHYKRWYNPFYDMHAYHVNLMDNYHP